MNPAVPFILGAAVMFIISAVVFGRLVTVWYDKEARASELFLPLCEQVATLEATKTPLYKVGVGVDSVAIRNVPAVDEPRLPVESMVPGEMIDLTGADE